ncbi:MAG TPA: type II secretion system F family protein [Acidimicrobiales bacterium]
MNTRLLLLAGAAGWVGATLLLSGLPWFARGPLVERLRPYARSRRGGVGPAGAFSVASVVDLVAPLARGAGERIARLVGIEEDLASRLARIHSPVDPTSFRLRQVGYAIVAAAIAVPAALVLGFPPVAAVGVLLVSPLLGFLLPEQQLAGRSDRWKRDLFLELPVVAEQLGMQLRAGFSLTAALGRIAERGSGAVAADLARVCRRIRQGVPEASALREWAELARVPAVDRLVPVLALNRETSNLGRLISEEARALRRDLHRELIEQVERRNQQVWIPVTVAALVPGVLFMTIPFVEALRLFGG